MKRIALAACAAATMAFAGSASAQNVDFSKVEIKTTDLGHNTYRLEGQGGNITVAVGTDGIIMVDGQFAPLSAKIKAAIAAISPLPIKYLINTHFHGDHTGGNENFAKDGATVVAQDNVRVRLAAGTTNGISNAKTPPVAPGALPKQTYVGGSITLEVGGRKAQLTHVNNAHTDGDTWVWFADANVLCTGDTMNNTKRYQTIDFANGGDIRGAIRATDAFLGSPAPIRHQGDDRPRPARQEVGHRRVQRDAQDRARAHREAGQGGQERSRRDRGTAAQGPRRQMGRRRRGRDRLPEDGLQLVQAVLTRGRFAATPTLSCARRFSDFRRVPASA